MWIGVVRLTLDFYNNDSLKLKKKAIDSFCKEIRRKYHCSVLEVDSHDDLEEGVIGVSCLYPQSKSRSDAYQSLQRMVEVMDKTAPARVTSERLDLLSFGDEN